MTPIARSAIGWYTKSMKDGKITMLEWKKLVETSTRILVIEIVAYFGLNWLGMDVSVLGIAMGSFMFDMMLYPLWKKLGWCTTSKDKFGL